ncbi:hypothetical protein X975_11661, partial [Stegodyphus mimosarum]
MYLPEISLQMFCGFIYGARIPVAITGRLEDVQVVNR